VHHVIVMPVVSEFLGKIGLSRRLLLAVLNRVYDQLENHAVSYQSRRDPKDENLFDYVVCVGDDDSWHTLRFSVDDHLAQGHLFVVAVSHRRGKLRF
jgi:hypothetical protein